MKPSTHGRRIVFVLVCAVSFGSPVVSVGGEDPVTWWRFEAVPEQGIFDTAGQIHDSISGGFKPVEGVAGRALRLDGFSTVIRRDAERAPRLEGAFTLDAWVAIAAYPWNWCPILAQEQDGEYGYRFGIGPQGRIRLQLAVGGSWLSLASEQTLPLRAWSHVAAVYDESFGMRLYVNGALAGEREARGSLAAAPETDLLIGMNREKVPPSHAVPPAAGTLPSWFSLDGVLDEVRIFDRALSPEEIERAARAGASAQPPEIPPRVMPSGPAGPGRFGAYYVRLEYYEEWDALWRVADHPDVVVQFDDSPVRVVFWRGLRYSPAWVTENGLWLADQSGESGNEEGCIEHMQDIHNLYSHVRIIESSPARAVVHWRYAPVSAHQNLWTADERTGWAWWVDEYYTFYPDGTGVRKVRWRQPGSGLEFPWLQIQETSVLCHPGQNAGDVLENDALTLLNLEGHRHTYSWPDDDSVDTRERRNMPVDPSIIRDVRPNNPVIQVVNMRSAARPFVILEPGNAPNIYVGRVRSQVVNFPAYNHWPVSQVRSDGRFAQAADRATSFSISQLRPRRHREEGGIQWVAMLYGATFEDPVELVPLAKSWIHPPELRVVDGAVENRGYDVTQRAYLLACSPEAGCGDLSLEFGADPDSPLANAFLILEGWGDTGLEVRLDGQPLVPGEDFRPSPRKTIRGTDLLLWLEVASTEPARVGISRHQPVESAVAGHTSN
jgi:hypothetical protein